MNFDIVYVALKNFHYIGTQYKKGEALDKSTLDDGDVFDLKAYGFIEEVKVPVRSDSVPDTL